MLKKSTSILMIALLTSCAITPRQIDSNEKIKKAVKLCVEAFPVANNSYNSSYQMNNYKLFTEIKNEYPKEWEKFKEKNKNKANVYPQGTSDVMDNIWSGLFMSVFTVGLAPFFHSIDLITPAKKNSTYPELLELCDQKIPVIMEAKTKQAEIDERMRPERERLRKEQDEKDKSIFEAEQKRQEKLQKEAKLFIQQRGFSRMIDGLKYAVNEAYFLDKKANLKTSLVIFNPHNGNENGLSVVSLQDNYAIYSNKVFTVAIKQRPNKSYLKDSLINGTYYKFIGTKRFNNKDFGKDELVLFEEVIGLEKYDQDLVRRIFN